MLRHTRRRALGLLIAACGTSLIARAPRAFAQDESEADNETPDCLDSKEFGPWTAQATDIGASATQRNVPTADPETCDLALEFQVNAEYDARIFVEGSPDGTPLPQDVLVRPRNRLTAKTAGGEIAVDEALCGNCTDFYKDTVNIVLPLATAPLLREEDTIEIGLRLEGKEKDCRFGIDCVTMREALRWAAARRDTLVERRDENACLSAEDCFITSACCEVVGLSDDCFELRTLRRYRDEVLANKPNGPAEIARYYALAPATLSRLRARPTNPEAKLLSVYARFVLPAAIAAWFGLNALAHWFYVRMLTELAGPGATKPF